MYGLKSRVKITPVTKIKARSQGAAAFSSLLILIFLSSHTMLTVQFLKFLYHRRYLRASLESLLRFLSLPRPLHVSLPSHLTSGAVPSFFIRAMFIVALLGLYKCWCQRNQVVKHGYVSFLV